MITVTGGVCPARRFVCALSVGELVKTELERMWKNSPVTRYCRSVRSEGLSVVNSKNIVWKCGHIVWIVFSIRGESAASVTTVEVGAAGFFETSVACYHSMQYYKPARLICYLSIRKGSLRNTLSVRILGLRSEI